MLQEKLFHVFNFFSVFFFNIFLKVLQEKLPPNTSQAHTMSMVELQGWVTSCRKFLKTNMGSFLMRSARDEPLLIGESISKALAILRL